MVDLYQLHLLMEKDLLQPRGKFILRKINYVEITYNTLKRNNNVYDLYFSSHSDKNVKDAIDALNPDKVIRVGGAGHKVSYLYFII